MKQEGRWHEVFLQMKRKSISQVVEQKPIIWRLSGLPSKIEKKGNHIITTNQEHHAIYRSAEYLEQLGFDVTYLPIYENGLISLDDLKEALTEKTILVSVMYVNNETGVIQQFLK